MSKTFEEKLALVMDEVQALLLAKNKAYGNSALEPVRIFSKASAEEQLKVRIDDKLSRLVKGSDYLNEDTVTDLLGYLILLKVAGLKDSNRDKGNKGFNKDFLSFNTYVTGKITDYRDYTKEKYNIEKYFEIETDDVFDIRVDDALENIILEDKRGFIYKTDLQHYIYNVMGDEDLLKEVAIEKVNRLLGGKNEQQN